MTPIRSLSIFFLLILLTQCTPKGNEENPVNNLPKNKPTENYLILGTAHTVEMPPRSEMGKPAYRQAKEAAMVKAQKQILDWLGEQGARLTELPLVAPKAHGIINNQVVVCMEITAEKLQQALSEKNVAQAEAIAKKTGQGIQSWSSESMN
ncbi:MAG: hypothetical protein AABZ60_07065 [Planctomycetota bacterium]